MRWFALCLILSLFVQSSAAFAAEKRKEKAQEKLHIAAAMPDGVTRFSPPRPAPEYVFQDETGNDVALADFRGRFVLLNIWATWCGPCIEELPHLQAVQDKFSGASFTVVTVAIDRNPELVPGFLHKRNLTLSPFTDAASTSSTALGVAGLPTTFLVDPQGLILWRGIGGIPWGEPPYLDLIRQVLAPQKI